MKGKCPQLLLYKQRERESERARERERERDRLRGKDTERERETDREMERDRQTDRETDRETETEIFPTLDGRFAVKACCMPVVLGSATLVSAVAIPRQVCSKSMSSAGCTGQHYSCVCCSRLQVTQMQFLELD